MATQIYDIDLYETYLGSKEILSKQEVKEFCKPYNQNTAELHTFLTKFNFDEWVCTGVRIEDIYSPKNDKQAFLDCSSPSILGILMTSSSSEEAEGALRKLLGFQNDIVFNDVDFDSFICIRDCPLLVLHIADWSKFVFSGIILVPKKLWNREMYDPEGYGYPYNVRVEGYGNPGRYWYIWRKDKLYQALRVGGHSLNFLNCSNSIDQENLGQVCYDPNKNRLLFGPSYRGEVQYYDLSDGATKTLVTFEGEEYSDLYIEDQYYYFSKAKGFLTTDNNFEHKDTPANLDYGQKKKIINYYKNNDWEVIITNRGLQIRSESDLLQTKLSSLKLNTFAAKNKALIGSFNSKNLYIYYDKKLITVTSTLDISITKLAPIVKKEYLTIKEDDVSSGGRSTVEFDTELWFFKGLKVWSIKEKADPVLLNNSLYKLTGEVLFHAAVEDKELKGTWLLAGIGKLIFIDKKRSTAFVFCLEHSHEGPGQYPMGTAFFDKEKNLWFSLRLGEKLHCIDRAELKEKLKLATPFKNVNLK